MDCGLTLPIPCWQAEHLHGVRAEWQHYNPLLPFRLDSVQPFFHHGSKQDILFDLQIMPGLVQDHKGGPGEIFNQLPVVAIAHHTILPAHHDQGRLAVRPLDLVHVDLVRHMLPQAVLQEGIIGGF